MTTVVTISSSTQCSSPEPRSKVLTSALVFKPSYSNKRSQIPRLKNRCHKSKSPYSLSIDSGKCSSSINTISGFGSSNINYSISTKGDSSYNHNLADPTPFTHLSDSSPCSPTSTTTNYLATPEWASSDQSCRSYLTLLTSSIKRSNECDSDSDSNNHSSSSSSSSSFSKSEKSWSKRSLTNHSASYSFSFGCLSSPFNGKRQKKAKTHNHNQDSTLNSNGENSNNNMPYNSYCSVCTEYRNFYQKSCDLTNNYMECEKCHSATRRRCSSPSSLLNTNYISFPSIDESLSSSSNIEINPATATSSTLPPAIYLPLADNEESLFSSTAPSFDSISTADQLQKMKKPLFSSFSLPLSSA